MARPRKTPKVETPAPAPQPAANPFGAAPGGTPPAPMFGGAGQSPAPTPTPFGAAAPIQQPAANPAPGMFGAAAAAHPTQNPAAPAAAVDLSPVLKAIEDLKKEVLQQVNAGLQDIRAVHTRLQVMEGKLGTPQAQSAATQTAPAQPSPPVQAATATPQTQFPADQVAQVVTYIRQGLQVHYAAGGVPINVNNPEHQTMLTNAAVSAGAAYLQGADATNEDLKKHIVQSLQQAGAVDAQGNAVA